MEKIKKRYAYWDNIKGILILLVVFAHLLMCIENIYPNRLLMCIVYFFHMPVFVFVSGFFSKSEHSRCFDSILKLAVAFFLLNSGFMFWRSITYSEIPSLTAPYYSAWYLFSLIVWRLIAPYLAKIKNIMIYLIIIAILSACWSDIGMQWAMIKTVAFVPFFMAGYLFPQEKALLIVNMPKTKKYLFCIVSALLAIFLGIFLSKHFNIGIEHLLLQTEKMADINNIYSRASFFIVSIFATLFFMFLSIEKKIPFITKIGKNTLVIYILHRPITLGYIYFVNHFNLTGYNSLLFAVLATFLICFITGSNCAFGILDFILNILCNAIKGNDNKIKQIFSSLIVTVIFIATASYPLYANRINLENNTNSEQINEHEFKNAFKIAFVGDLILLENQVKRAKTKTGYNFNPKFKYTKKYIESADLAIGVLEGPLGQGIVPFSQGNILDNRFEYVNFPDDYADAIKNAGFDLLTTADNHLLDAGIKGANRTIDILNKKKIDYIGSYKNENEHKNRVKLIEKDGIKMAFIAYTYGINNHSDNELINGKLSYITSVLPDTDSPLFPAALKNVKEDFAQAKSYNPDLIIVLPHWGIQFTEKISMYQKEWEQIFINHGADIILGAHSHHVQKVRIKEQNGKKIYSLYSPGNFVNQFIRFNGDASVIAEIYIDKKTKKIIGGSIVPLWSYSKLNGNFVSIPVYEALNDKNINSKFSVNDFERVKEIHNLILKYMLNIEYKRTNKVRPRYYFT